MRRGRGSSLCLAWRRDAELRLSNTYKEVIEKMEPGSPPWCMEGGREVTETERRAVQTGCKGNFFSLRGQSSK